MASPAINLHVFYSLKLCKDVDIIFEDLDMLNTNVLKKVITTKQLGNIQLVDNALNINTDTSRMRIIGHNINGSTYMVKRDGSGDIFSLSYKCSDADILTGIEHLYHMSNNLV